MSTSMVSYNAWAHLILLLDFYFSSYGGLAGYLAGVSVAVKQAMPDHVLYRSPVGKITNRNIPLAVFGLSFVMWAVGLVEGSYCTMFGSGLVRNYYSIRSF